MPFVTNTFIKGIISGQIKPQYVKKALDKYGKPIIIFDFPESECQIHAHYSDKKCEVVSTAHIIPYFREKEKTEFIDNYALSMLRHYAKEIANPSSVTEEQDRLTPKKHKKSSNLKFFLVGTAITPFLYTIF